METMEIETLIVQARQIRKLEGRARIAGVPPGIKESKRGAETIYFLNEGLPCLDAEEGDCSFFLKNIKSMCGGDCEKYDRIYLTMKLALEALAAGGVAPVAYVFRSGKGGIRQVSTR